MYTHNLRAQYQHTAIVLRGDGVQDLPRLRLALELVQRVRALILVLRTEDVKRARVLVSFHHRVDLRLQRVRIVRVELED